MAVKFFGQFLVEKGVVSRETLLQAIELQESVNLSFGATSLAMGILTEADIERIHNAQRIEDLRFGDMAVKLGLLTSEQMMQVLTRQKNTHLYIGEALVKVGSFQADELPKYLEEFKADQAQYATDTVVIPTGVSEPKIWEMVADLSYKMLTRVALLVFRPEPCFVADRVPAMDVYATMDFTGDISGRYFMGVTAATQKKNCQGDSQGTECRQRTKGNSRRHGNGIRERGFGEHRRQGGPEWQVHGNSPTRDHRSPRWHSGA